MKKIIASLLVVFALLVFSPVVHAAYTPQQQTLIDQLVSLLKQEIVMLQSELADLKNQQLTAADDVQPVLTQQINNNQTNMQNTQQVQDTSNQLIQTIPQVAGVPTPTLISSQSNNGFTVITAKGDSFIVNEIIVKDYSNSPGINFLTSDNDSFESTRAQSFSCDNLSISPLPNKCQSGLIFYENTIPGYSIKPIKINDGGSLEWNVNYQLVSLTATGINTGTVVTLP